MAQVQFTIYSSEKEKSQKQSPEAADNADAGFGDDMPPLEADDILGTGENASMAVESSFSVYEDIREKLIARGVPAGEIAFIHDANTEVKKKELFAKVRSGQVRVLLGSTAKMGAGTNVRATRL